MSDLIVSIAFDVPGSGGMTRCAVNMPDGSQVFFVLAYGPIALRALSDFLDTVRRERFPGHSERV